MKWIRERVLRREWMSGTVLNLGSSLTAEIAGKAGFDWLFIDLEHGMGDRSALLLQLQALESSPAAPVVRVAWNDRVLFKTLLDLGPSGLLIPFVCTVEEARNAAAAMRYPPAGVRGVARMNRACEFGPGFDDYFKNANSNLLTVVQIETKEAVENASAIAAVEGVDVLFVGPLDLSVSLAVPGQFSHASVQSALAKISDACRQAGKAAGILVANEEELKIVRDLGYTFNAMGSDGAGVVQRMREIAGTFKKVAGK